MMRRRKSALRVSISVLITLSLLFVSWQGRDEEEIDTLEGPHRQLLAVVPEYVGMTDERNIKCLFGAPCESKLDCQNICNSLALCPGYRWPRNPSADDLIPGWVCSKIDPLTDFITDEFDFFRKKGSPCILYDDVIITTTKQNAVIAHADGTKFTLLVGTQTCRPAETTTCDIVSIDSADIFRDGISCKIKSDDGALYPPDVFSKKQRQQGALVLYVLGIFYMFFALAIVCDDYFVPALEALSVKLQLSDDVAGATFMAAGGSAPELFTSFIGVFFAKSDVGFGTIVGSAVFNVLFVIGACALATRHMAADTGGLPLTWWPLARDSAFYLADLILLVIFFRDKRIDVWESGLLLLCYACYVVFMGWNETCYSFIRRKLDERSVKVSPETGKTHTSEEDEELKSKKPEGSGTGWVQAKSKARRSSTAQLLTKQRSSLAPKETAPGQADKGKENQSDNRGTEDDEEEEEEEEDQPWSPLPPSDGIIKWLLLFPLNFPLWAILPCGEKLGEEKEMFAREQRMSQLALRLYRLGGLKTRSDGSTILHGMSWFKDHAAQLLKDDDELREEGDSRPASEVVLSLIESFDSDGGTGHAQAAVFLGWSASNDNAPSPIYAKHLKEKFGSSFGFSYVGGFLGSIGWIGFFSYLMVWWAETLGDTLGIPSVVMGITILAAGTSVPDLISSVIVARSGKGDMAVSSSIGSNIFDVTFGLPMPWFFWSVTHGGQGIEVEAKSLGSSVLMLVGMLICTIAAIALLGWRLNQLLGGLSFILYTVFVTITLLMAFETIPVAF